MDELTSAGDDEMSFDEMSFDEMSQPNEMEEILDEELIESRERRSLTPQLPKDYNTFFAGRGKKDARCD